MSAAELESDRIRRRAAERYVEIISEASRRLDPAWRASMPHVPWDKIAGIGNVLRHDCDEVSIAIIVALRGESLDDLEAAVGALLQAHDPEGVALKQRLKDKDDL